MECVYFDEVVMDLVLGRRSFIREMFGPGLEERYLQEATPQYLVILDPHI